MRHAGNTGHVEVGAFLEDIQDALPIASGFVVSTERPDMGWLIYNPDGRELTIYEDGTWKWKTPIFVEDSDVTRQ